MRKWIVLVIAMIAITGMAVSDTIITPPSGDANWLNILWKRIGKWEMQPRDTNVWLGDSTHPVNVFMSVKSRSWATASNATKWNTHLWGYHYPYADTSLYLAGIGASQFLRSDVADSASGNMSFLAGGLLGDNFLDTWYVKGWLDWTWAELDPALHGEAVRCAVKLKQGSTGTQFQAGFFAVQNKFSMPSGYMEGGVEGKGTASAPCDYIRGVRGSIVVKDSGAIIKGTAGVFYTECLGGGSADTMINIYIDDNGTWGGTVTKHYGIFIDLTNPDFDIASTDGVLDIQGLSINGGETITEFTVGTADSLIITIGGHRFAYK